MQIISENINAVHQSRLDILDRMYPGRSIMMFDIETTGLSPDRAYIYIIGMNIRIDGKWQIVLLFNEDGKSEPELIRHFQNELSKHDLLIEFNGDAFDINFVRRRMEYIQRRLGITISDYFPRVESLDLYKRIRPYKFALGLPNVKQKTVEQYLGVRREDKYNGGQLIDIYFNYLTDRDRYSRSLLLQHNRDDMEGMLYLIDILSIDSISQGEFEFSSLSTSDASGILMLILKYNLKYAFPVPVFTSRSGIAISINGTELRLETPITSSVLYYYYPGTRSASEPKESWFISQLDTEISLLPCYKEAAKSKETYLELTDSLLGSPEMLKAYAANIADSLLKQKNTKKEPR